MTRLPLQTRIVALAGLLVTAVLIVGTQLVARGIVLSDTSTSAPETKSATIATRDKKVSEAATKLSSAKQAAPKGAAGAPAWVAKLRESGLPPTLVRELEKHRVVVVSIYAPRGAIDRLALIEARAGAKRAGVGFAAMNVFRRRQARPFAAKLGVMDAPAVLVYRRPDRLVIELDGFADLETVAQAAADARA